MSIDTTHRSETEELMDDFTLEGEILRDALDKIASINKLLGGNNVTLNGVIKLTKDLPKNTIIKILDVGCGNGDMLRVLSDYGSKNGYNFILVGIDANAFTIKHAESLTLNFANISYQCKDICKEPIADNYDIILCTLTLHHFKDKEIIGLVKIFHQQSKLGIVINDLHRSKIAYHLFKLICLVFGLNDMSRDDGLVSILRGFKKSDLQNYAEQLNLKRFSIHWKWAFRYQWIINRHERKNQNCK